MNTPSQEGALAGLKVLDLSRVLAGPWCTQILADLGADVVKVERPGVGDDTRSWGPPFLTGCERGARPTRPPTSRACNRNKRSVTIDMATPEGQALLQQMAARSDIVVENFKTGGLKQYGLDHAEPARRQPAPDLLQRHRLRPRRPVREPRRLRPADPGGQRHDEHHRPPRRRARRRPDARRRGADRHLHRHLCQHRHPGGAARCGTAAASASTSTWRCSTSAWRFWPTRPAPSSTPASRRRARATPIRAWRRTRTSAPRTAR